MWFNDSTWTPVSIVPSASDTLGSYKSIRIYLLSFKEVQRWRGTSFIFVYSYCSYCAFTVVPSHCVYISFASSLFLSHSFYSPYCFCPFLFLTMYSLLCATFHSITTYNLFHHHISLFSILVLLALIISFLQHISIMNIWNTCQSYYRKTCLSINDVDNSVVSLLEIYLEFYLTLSVLFIFF